MATKKHQPFVEALWSLAERQHGVVARWQLMALGFSPAAIKHRAATGRLHPVHRGVYAVGRPELTQRGRWLGAVLACGPGAWLSHSSATGLWGMTAVRTDRVEVSVVSGVARQRPGLIVHRRYRPPAEDLAVHQGIPVSSPALTLLDAATQLGPTRLERAINEADRLDRIDPEALREAVPRFAGRPGVRRLRTVLDRQTFRLTDSELEQRFLVIVQRAGLPLPRTRQYRNGFRVDFLWPDLGLIVETDGLRYHRTAAQQTRDQLRFQKHAASGMTALRFTHAQVRYESPHVQHTLAAVARRLRRQTVDGLGGP